MDAADGGLVIWPRRAASCRCSHFNAAITLVDQVEDVGCRLQPLCPICRLPLSLGLRKRFQESLNEGVQRTEITATPITASLALLLGHTRLLSDSRPDEPV